MTKEQVVTSPQKDISGYLKLAEQFLGNSQFKEASDTCTQALAIKPGDAACLNLSAIIALRINRRDIALTILLESTTQNPGHLLSHANLSMVYKMTGNSELAIQSFQKALSIPTGLDHTLKPLEFLRAGLHYICEQPKDSWWEIRSFWNEYGNLLEHFGYLNQQAKYLVQALASKVESMHLDNGTILSLLKAFAFTKSSSIEWNGILFDLLCLPWAMRAIKEKRYNLAMDLESYSYQAYIKQNETDKFFRSSYGKWVEPMRAAGKQAAEEHLSLAKPVNKTEKPIIGFFLHSASLLAHVQVLLANLEGMVNLPELPYTPVVYIFSGHNEELARILNKLNVQAVFMETESPATASDHYQRLLVLRRKLAQENVTALVWVSVVIFMPFAFSLKMAPIQIWWAMKYHGVEAPEIDGYVTGGSISKFKTIYKKKWRTAPTGLANWTSPELINEALEIRSRFDKYKIILGCFGREEKLTDPAFLSSITNILKQNPHAVFLWTGKTQLHEIQEIFEKSNVSDRCAFIGWVNTRKYAYVIDIFLDSFPFPCGFTLIEAMAIAKPVVLFASDESYETGIHGIISPALSEENTEASTRERLKQIYYPNVHDTLYFCASNTEQYETLVGKLIDNPELRRTSGAANKLFVDEFMSNPLAMAEGYANHFMEIIDQNKLKRT